MKFVVQRAYACVDASSRLQVSIRLREQQEISER